MECLSKDRVKKIVYMNKSIFFIALSNKYGKKCRLYTVLFLDPLKLFAIFYVPNTLRLYLVRTDQSI